MILDGNTVVQISFIVYEHDGSYTYQALGIVCCLPCSLQPMFSVQVTPFSGESSIMNVLVQANLVACIVSLIRHRHFNNTIG